MSKPDRRAEQESQAQSRDEPITFSVTPEEEGLRLDRFLAQRQPDLSRSRLKSLIEAGCLTRDGETIREASTRVKSKQTYSLTIPKAEPAEPQPQDIALDILYEDADLLVLDKPAGMVVHPAPGNPDQTLVNALLAHCAGSLSGIGGVERPGIVHRLDKDTSGLMVVAKEESTHKALTEAFGKREIDREYMALVWGHPKSPEGEISGNIGRSSRNRQKMAVVPKGGKEAATRYKLLQVFAQGRVSLIACKLMTGRTHQIRVHMTEIGLPLLGDPLYGRATRLAKAEFPELDEALDRLPGQALHARSLGFIHPRSGEKLFFESSPPPAFQSLLSCLEQL